MSNAECRIWERAIRAGGKTPNFKSEERASARPALTSSHSIKRMKWDVQKHVPPN